jgi:hypothetical protein
LKTGVALPALNEGSVFVLGIWIGHGEDVDEDHMVTLQIVLTTVDKEWILVPGWLSRSSRRSSRTSSRPMPRRWSR